MLSCVWPQWFPPDKERSSRSPGLMRGQKTMAGWDQRGVGGVGAGVSLRLGHSEWVSVFCLSCIKNGKTCCWFHTWSKRPCVVSMSRVEICDYKPTYIRYITKTLTCDWVNNEWMRDVRSYLCRFLWGSSSAGVVLVPTHNSLTHSRPWLRGMAAKGGGGVRVGGGARWEGGQKKEKSLW